MCIGVSDGIRFGNLSPFFSGVVPVSFSQSLSAAKIFFPFVDSSLGSL